MFSETDRVTLWYTCGGGGLLTPVTDLFIIDLQSLNQDALWELWDVQKWYIGSEHTLSKVVEITFSRFLYLSDNLLAVVLFVENFDIKIDGSGGVAVVPSLCTNESQVQFSVPAAVYEFGILLHASKTGLLKRVRTVAKRHMRSSMFTVPFILVPCVKLP